MEIEPMDQFLVEPMPFTWANVAVIWLEVSVMIVQLAVIALILTAYPLWRVLPRVGVSKWWALASAFPPAAIVLIWLVGLRAWQEKE